MEQVRQRFLLLTVLILALERNIINLDKGTQVCMGWKLQKSRKKVKIVSQLVDIGDVNPVAHKNPLSICTSVHHTAQGCWWIKER